MIIPKHQLTERLRPGAPYVEDIRRVVEGAYQLAAEAENERRSLYDTRTANSRQLLKQAVESTYAPRLADLAKPLAALREKVQADRKEFAGTEYHPAPHMRELNQFIALADAALWAARKDLSTMSGVPEIRMQLMEVGQ